MTPRPTFDALTDRASDGYAALWVGGSHLHGNARPDSGIDLRAWTPTGPLHARRRNDCNFETIGGAGLAARLLAGDPHWLECLDAPDDCLIHAGDTHRALMALAARLAVTPTLRLGLQYAADALNAGDDPWHTAQAARLALAVIQTGQTGRWPARPDGWTGRETGQQTRELLRRATLVTRYSPLAEHADRTVTRRVRDLCDPKSRIDVIDAPTAWRRLAEWDEKRRAVR